MPPKTKEKQADPNTQMGEANQRNMLDYFPRIMEPRAMPPKEEKKSVVPNTQMREVNEPFGQFLQTYHANFMSKEKTLRIFY